MHKILKKLKSDQKGAAMFVFILTVMTAGMVMAQLAAEIGLDDARNTYDRHKSLEALILAEGCAEEAMRRIRLDNNYGVGVGNINLAVPTGSCIINIQDPSSLTRYIGVTGEVSDGADTYTRAVFIQLFLDESQNELEVVAWDEI